MQFPRKYVISLRIIISVLLLVFIIAIVVQNRGEPNLQVVEEIATDQEPLVIPTDPRSVRRDPVSSSTPISHPDTAESDYEIITVLGYDAIQSIDNPKFYSADEADHEYNPQELVLGVAIDGESKAYSTTHLNRHEIVNDTIAGRKIAVTW